MPKFITDFETWLLDYGDRLYRYLVYKKMFTPYEQQQALKTRAYMKIITMSFVKSPKPLTLVTEIGCSA